MTTLNSTTVFNPSHYQVLVGRDVDKRSMSATFAERDSLLKSLRLPYSSAQLLSYVYKHYPNQRIAFVYEAGPTANSKLKQASRG